MSAPLTHSLISVTKKYISAFAAHASKLDIERYQFVLVLIDEHDQKLTQKALAAILEIDKSYMVNIIDYLAERGYVTREKNPADRREQLIRLTAKAENDIPHIKKIIDELNKQSLKNVSQAQLNTFNEVLKIIQTNLSYTQPTEIMLDYKKLNI